MIRTLINLACFIVLLGTANEAFPGTYFIATTGSGSACSSDSPCSASYGMANAVAGDIWIFQPGTYALAETSGYETPSLDPANSGTPELPIIFRATAGTVIMTASNPSNCPVSALIGASRTSYIVWDGFILDTSTYPGACNTGPVSFGKNGAGRHNTLVNCELIGHYNTVNDNYAGIAVSNQSYLLIKNNIIRGFISANGFGSPFIFFTVDHAIIENNDIYSNSTGGYDKQNGMFNTYLRNFIHDNASHAFYLMTQGGFDASNITFRQNIFANNTGGFYIDAGDSPQTIANLTWQNNTYFNNGGGITFSGGAVSIPSSARAWNNIIYDSGINAVSAAGVGTAGVPAYVDYNNYYGSNFRWVTNYGSGASIYYYSLASWQEQGFDINAVTTDPGFLNASGNYSLATDYRRSSYPANGRGGNFLSVMGAHVTGSEIIGFCANLPARINNTEPGYSSIQAAYAAALNGDTIMIQAGSFPENPALRNNTNITLTGGYDCDFSSNDGHSLISGSLTIGGPGRVQIDRLIIM
jgi:hypothetical protein